MKESTIELLEVNSDIVTMMAELKEIGWKQIREKSIHRILYLSGVLHAFVNNTSEDTYHNYHFSVTESGPFSTIIDRSMLDLKVREILVESAEGDLNLDKKTDTMPVSDKAEWFKTVVYILSKYGESKIFGFVIQDPEYKESFQRNSQMDINISTGNRTTLVLNKFKKAFEENLTDVTQISQKEYLELYFEYVFSKIIKKEY